MARKKYPEPKEFEPRYPGKYKGTLPIIARSSWEWDLMTLLDKHPSVRIWSSESVIIQYRSPVDQKTHRYFPDFYVEYVGEDGKIRTEILEVKPYGQTVKPTFGPRATDTTKRKAFERYAVNLAKWEAAKGYCDQKGYDFRVLTEKQLYGRRK